MLPLGRLRASHHAGVTTLAAGHGPHTRHEAMKKRPLSPFFSIYEPQLTWLMSISHRLTGAGLAVGLYASCIGATLSSTGIIDQSIPDLYTFAIQAAAAAPQPMVYMGKMVVAPTFVYHSLNGLRHLLWDVGAFLSLKGVYVTGWAVNLASLFGGLALALIY